MLKLLELSLHWHWDPTAIRWSYWLHSAPPTSDSSPHCSVLAVLCWDSNISDDVPDWLHWYVSTAPQLMSLWCYHWYLLPMHGKEYTLLHHHLSMSNHHHQLSRDGDQWNHTPHCTMQYIQKQNGWYAVTHNETTEDRNHERDKIITDSLHWRVNPLTTKLSCWNFNLVNADHFYREYLVCLLCYWSQICVLLRQWVAAIAHTQVGRYAPPTCKVKPIKCSDLVKFCSKLVLWGWLLKSTCK